MKRILFLFIFLYLNLLSQPVQLSYNIEPDSARIGDRININFNIFIHKQLPFSILNWENNLPQNIELKQQSEKLDTLWNDQKNKISLKRQIACFDTGLISLPPFEVKVSNDPDDSLGTIYGTDSIYVYIQSVLPDSASAIIGQKDPLPYPFPWIKWTLSMIGSLLFIILVIFIFKKYFRIKPIAKIDRGKAIPPHIIAMNKLDKLEPEHIYEHVQAKEFYYELSYILREYLENRYHHNYLELTTYELKPMLKKQINSIDIYNDAIEVLFLSDEVKFAKKFPQQSVHNHMRDKTRNIVNKTFEQIEESTEVKA